MRRKGFLWDSLIVGRPGGRRIAVLFLAVAMLIAPVYAQNQGVQLDVPLYGQQTAVWCWDASSLMVIKYFRPTSGTEQCTLASEATGVACCATPIPTPCVQTGWEMISRNGFTFSSKSDPLSWTDLVAQISTKKKPVLFAWVWNGSNGHVGHMLVATGWLILAGQHFVRVNNPSPQPPPGAAQEQGGEHELYSYDAWVGGEGYDHSFWANWYDIVDAGKVSKIGPIGKNPGPSHDKLGPFSKPEPSSLLSKLVVRPDITRRATATLEAIRAASPALAVQLGFATADEAKQAQLGSPLREYYVRLDTLREYTPNVPVARVLSGVETLFYPLVSHGVIRSSLRISAPDGKTAKTISIGDTGTARHLQLLEELARRIRKGSGDSTPAVRVPALGLYFITRAYGSTLQIASLFDVPQYELQRGKY